jgi:hypothetical protein
MTVDFAPVAACCIELYLIQSRLGSGNTVRGPQVGTTVGSGLNKDPWWIRAACRQNFDEIL